MPEMDETTPMPSRWDQEGAEYVRSNGEWVARFARELAVRLRDVTLAQAFDLAQELSLDDNVRALAPERAAQKMAASPWTGNAS